MVILDTSIIIDHLRSASFYKSKLLEIVEKNPKQVLAVSMITIQELFEGKSTKISDKERDLLGVISPLKILPYSYEVAKLAGIIARDLPRSIELADAAIAATAIVYDAQLATLNEKDFVGIPEIEVYSVV